MDEMYMKRCLELARMGIGNVSPNPMVGAVIVYKNRIIGEGYHKKYGDTHAEVNSINSVKDRTVLKDSTMYINLEPCSHFGKTPPCSDLIIKEGIKKIIVGTSDTSSKVDGDGINKLRDAGCFVSVGIIENECREINKRFFCFHEKKRPYVILKWAKTKDNFVDVVRKSSSNIGPYQISNDISRTLVHKWRSEEDSIFIGRNTALLDNPKLNVREWSGNNPVRMVLDTSLKLDPNLFIFDNSTKTIVFTNKEIGNSQNIEYIKFDISDSINSILKILYDKKILSIFVEGGPTLQNSFINEGIWDETRVFTNNTIIGKGVKAPELEIDPFSQEKIGDNTLEVFKPG